MCGIVGIVSSAPVDSKCVERMRDSLVHRGPDAAGMWRSSDGRVCLGHRRLAIVDLTPDANQPFLSADGRFVITFNGEIYNFKSLRQELAEQGIQFRTHSDTEVLLEAFRVWGPTCLDRLSGMFAFAIWDNVERRLFCARDRVGEKPFYYAQVGNEFLLASELKAFLHWPAFHRRLHYPALIDYLTFGFVADPKSIWEGCYKLPPGHYMTVTVEPGGRVTVQPSVAYWDMDYAPDHSSSIASWESRILETLQTASREMMVADVPLGAFLSGGVDSSSVTAALSKAGCNVNTFTIGFEEVGYDERPWAQMVAQQYGTKHTAYVVRAEDIATVFDQLVWHYDEPFNDYSYLPTFYLCRESRKAITVALSGDGGDEMFGGYVKYQRLAMRQHIERFLPAPIKQLVCRGLSSFIPETNRWHRTLSQHAMDEPAMLIDMLLTGFPPTMLQAVARGPLAHALKHYGPFDTIQPLLRKAPPKQVGLINAMRYIDLKLTLGADILVKVDRASMAVSLEVRPVYLHRDMLALAGKIPPRLLADRHQAKAVLKSALRPWLPDSVLYRRKQGFAMPLKHWFQSDSGQLFGCNSGEAALDELMDGKGIAATIQKHRAQGMDVTSQAHNLMFLNRWLTKWG